MARVAWTRVEHSLLLRAWQEVVQEEDRDDGETKAAVSARVYRRFAELTKGTSKRTQNATVLQKAVLSFNFNFILHYNLTHGANAWVSLTPEEREQVYNREKTTKYYFVDLDPSMVATMMAIRKRLANSGGADGKSKACGAKMKTPRRVENAKQVYRAIVNAKGSEEEEEEEEDDEEEGESSRSESESDSSVDRRVKRKKQKIVEGSRKPDKSMRVERTAVVELLGLFKSGARRTEKLLLTDDQRCRRRKQIQREGGASVAKKGERGKLKTGSAKASQPWPKSA